MKFEKYTMSFTTGALFHRESVALAELYLVYNDWITLSDTVLSQNILQSRTQNTAKRVCREICSRLKKLNEHELNLLIHGTTQEQGYLLWLAICRRYTFIADFAAEVVHEHFVNMNFSLHYSDFDIFFNRKSEWHNEIESLSISTRAKLRQVVFKMLREAGLLTEDNTIVPPIFTSQFLDTISQADYNCLNVFPVSNTEIVRCLHGC